MRTVLPSIRFLTNQRSDRAEMLGADTATLGTFSESDDNMITGSGLEQLGKDTATRPFVGMLPPKRRSKPVGEHAVHEPLSIPVVPTLSRPPRMKRSGPMSLQWRSGLDQQPTNPVRISPEILGAFRKAIGATGKASAKIRPQRAA